MSGVYEWIFAQPWFIRDPILGAAYLVTGTLVGLFIRWRLVRHRWVEHQDDCSSQYGSRTSNCWCQELFAPIVTGYYLAPLFWPLCLAVWLASMVVYFFVVVPARLWHGTLEKVRVSDRGIKKAPGEEPVLSNEAIRQFIADSCGPTARSLAREVLRRRRECGVHEFELEALNDALSELARRQGGPINVYGLAQAWRKKISCEGEADALEKGLPHDPNVQLDDLFKKHDEILRQMEERDKKNGSGEGS